MAIEGITQSTQFLSFMLEDEVFAVDITKVREVLDFTRATKVPQTPDFMRGVINLRGGVVPVVDIKLKFGISKTEKDINTCVIIVEIDLDGESIILGALADSVKEVFDLHPEDIEPAPKIGKHLDTRFLKGMGKKDDEFILLLDIDRVFSSDELDLVQKVGRQGTEIQEEEAVAL